MHFCIIIIMIQVDSAMLLLKRGADKQILNHSHQPANQVAILCGHHHLSSGILRFTDSEVGMY